MTGKTFELKIIPNAKKNAIKGNKVYLTAPPIEGRANEALIEFLAEHFNIKKRQIIILRGKKSRTKVIKVQATSL